MNTLLEYVDEFKNDIYSGNKLKSIYLFLKYVAQIQLCKKEDADKTEIMFLEAKSKHTGSFHFSIKWLLKYVRISNKDKDHIREIGSHFPE